VRYPRIEHCARFPAVAVTRFARTHHFTTALRRTADGGLNASWILSRPEERSAGAQPIALQAYFGSGFHNRHLRETTDQDWPLNVFSGEDAAAQLCILRAIPSGDLHHSVWGAIVSSPL
jgi:hypothetical protein